MDIVAINDAINMLVESDTTPANVSELAALYICKSNLENALESHSNTSGELLQDKLPYYCKYRDAKRRYQLGQTNEGEVIKAIKETCSEFFTFMEDMYSGTDMNKERLCIKQMIHKLAEKYDK